MAKDYYQGSNDSMQPGAPDGAAEEKSEPADNPQEESSEQETALLPKSIFDGDPEPGKECKFKVVHVYDNEVEVEYVKDGDKKEKSSMDNADNMMDKMAADGGDAGDESA